MDTPVETQLVVDGEWRPSTGGARYELHNPAWPKELVGTAAAASREDARLAIEAAQRAFPAWAALSYEERAAYLIRIADRLVDDPKDVEARVRLLTREHGKILKESTMEVTRLGERFRYCASLAERLSEDERQAAPPFDTIVTRQPRGVAALITPWNWPLSILGAKLPQALISGNTVVIKLSERASLAPALTVRRIAEVVPPGVVNLVTGMGPEVGDELVSHPSVRKVSFTGGTKIGAAIMARAAETLKQVTLELGGNDPALVLEDVDLSEGALARMVTGTFLTSGQVCMALKRLYVHESRYQELVDGFSAITEQYVVGNGLEPDVTMGPLNNEPQLETVRAFVAEARDKGATVREVGKVADEEAFEKGYFHLPTIVTDADPSLQVVRCEQFGPVVPIIPFNNDDEAVAMANDTEFGLCSSVWTQDRERALEVARRLEAGYTYLNAHGPMAQDGRAPFGGFKQSGVGRNLGYDGVLEFLEPHSISAAPGWLF
ncbi:MAG: aldehyde dehydrogenase family protein [Acidobacteriota bacterium]|nr:MAG: aldehyde dehydrogenase family protein [Acidobacteriota bacterium]